MASKMLINLKFEILILDIKEKEKKKLFLHHQPLPRAKLRKLMKVLPLSFSSSPDRFYIVWDV